VSDLLPPLGSTGAPEGVFARVFDDELFIVDLNRGEYFALDDIGTRLWSGIEQGRSLQEIALDVTRDYDAELQQVVADMEKLIAELLASGLLVRGTSKSAHGR
jgi:hypothetical protein